MICLVRFILHKLLSAVDSSYDMGERRDLRRSHLAPQVTVHYPTSTWSIYFLFI